MQQGTQRRRRHKEAAAGGAGVFVLLIAIVALREFSGVDLLAEAPPPAAPEKHHADPAIESRVSEAGLLERLYREERSDIMITLTGEVLKTLPDDNDGSRHQRFILRVSAARTVLIAHNIDLAQRVPLREGDTVTVRGEYEWTQQGGTMHWTHHDPQARREGGWIEHAGIRYE